MSKKRGEDRERVEVGDAFDCLAIAQQQAVHVRPFSAVSAYPHLKPELDEHEITVCAPTVDVTAQTRQAAHEPMKVGLRGADPDHGGCKRLYEHHVWV
jgi:hypothetical protein